MHHRSGRAHAGQAGGVACNGMNVSYDSPEEAAMTGFPARYCRVVSSTRHANAAFVLLDTGSPGHRYLYGSVCRRIDERWQELSSSNAFGWTQTDDERGTGVIVLWGEVPHESDMVRIAFDGDVHDCPVYAEVFTFLAWDRNQPLLSELPRVVALHTNGRWR